ncbi:hypothetical protein [Roseibacillus persicicus]|uniref:Uncharacterized protein n=1 Tax=Roseibacillus persicicus TaxID=454148 RepID=A0A918TDQ2_9BACT|nr:hypothetical protein [Roseibacillus persicicus]GHC41263.1 hypothetical protein GCM10007100_02440 [Roseibacillus persicicus]
MGTIKSTVLWGAFVCCGWAWGQDAEPKTAGNQASNDPFADDTTLGGGLGYSGGISPERKDRVTATLLIRSEIYEISALKAVELLDEYEEDVVALRAALLKLAAKKEVELVDTCALRADAGITASAEGIAETIYPTEYELPEVPQILASITQEEAASEPVPGKDIALRFLQEVANDATPTAFETRNTGSTTETEVRTVEAEEGTWDVRWAPEMVQLAGESSWQDGALTMPIFTSSRLNSSFRVKDGAWTLTGMMAVGRVEGGIDAEKKRIFLLRVKRVR